MKVSKQKYQYLVAESILKNIEDEYLLEEHEYYRIYSFYVTYSMCGSQSFKKRNFASYGWPPNGIKNKELKDALNKVLFLNGNTNFKFTEIDDLKTQFKEHDLDNYINVNVDDERFVIAKTSESNNYLKLFYRIRNGFAHGKFKLCLSSNNEKMVVIQDDNTHNVTARIVLRLSTIIGFIDAVDFNGCI